MFVIGLTGGIGTGKTQVSKILEELGAKIINADLLGHETYRPDTDGWREIAAQFGEGVLTPGGEVDRKALGAVVFSDAEALRRLNAIVHPRIYALVRQRLAGLADEGQSVAVVEAALLVEAGWTDAADEVWVTVSGQRDVVKRLRARDGLDEAAVARRVRSQMGQDERLRHADAVIENDGTLTQLRESVQELWDCRVQARQRR